jgi:hypothetical protein
MTLESLASSESIRIAWEKILSKFPLQLQQEFRDERPNPNQEDIDWFGSFRLLAKNPVTVSLRELLENNEDNILRAPPDIIEEINSKWGTAFDSTLSKVYDQNPDRLRKYSLLPSDTAHPSVMLDGEIIFGVGRFKAALLRQDHDLRVWKLSTKEQ